MRPVFLVFLTSLILSGCKGFEFDFNSSKKVSQKAYNASADSSWQSGTTTRYWDGCKPHCAWPRAEYSTPARTCDIDDNPLSDPLVKSSCDGGDSFTCTNYAPFEENGVSYGFAATGADQATCGQCFELVFQNKGLEGKRMIVQATNIGYDVRPGQFDLLIPGGGVGIFDSFSRQLGVNESDLGARFGGLLTACGNDKNCVKERCSIFSSFPKLEAGCNWFTDWFGGADNPGIMYRPVQCPQQLTAISGINVSPSNLPALPEPINEKTPNEGSCQEHKEWGNCDADWMMKWDLCSVTCDRKSTNQQQPQISDICPEWMPEQIKAAVESGSDYSWMRQQPDWNQCLTALYPEKV